MRTHTKIGRPQPHFQTLDQNTKGSIYYVRLQTSVGPLYKLGFTSMKSVKDRLAYQGRGHERLIDQVLGFIESDEALNIEQTIHRHLQRKNAFPMPEEEMPLFENGQSELYVDDVLGLDPKFDARQAERVNACIARVRMRSMGKTEADIAEALEKYRESLELQQDLLGAVAEVKSSWLGRLIGGCLDVFISIFRPSSRVARMDDGARLMGWYVSQVNKPDEAAPDELRLARTRQLKEMYKNSPSLQAISRASRERDGEASNRRVRAWRKSLGQNERSNTFLSSPSDFYSDLDANTPEKKQKRRVLLQGFEANVNAALTAIKTGDADVFERVVDMDAFAANLSEAMTADIHTDEDYFDLAMRAGLDRLARLMELPRGHDFLMHVVGESYKAFLLHWVKHGTLKSEQLELIEGGAHYPDELVEKNEPSVFSDQFFGPAAFIKAFGRNWKLELSTHRAGPRWAEIDVSLRNPETGFTSWLTVRATAIAPDGRIALAFPDLMVLYSKACAVTAPNASATLS